jgi:nucleoside-diphosphate-sugar epimerase
MRIMVTGADGYIGRGVVTQLLGAGHEVVACGYSAPDVPPSGNLTVRVGDVFDPTFSFESLPNALLHLAWRNGFRHNDVSHLEDLPRHYEFIGRALDAGVPRIAVMGSMHEVGYHEGAVTDDTPCNPTTPYGVAKNALRQLTGELCRQRGAKMQWLRGFYLVSADGRGSSVFAKLVQADREDKVEFPFTSGRNAYDFLPYDEFCRQVVAVVTQDEVCGIINVCSGRPVALGDYIEGFIRRNDLKIRLAYGKYPDRPYDSPAIWGDDAKIRKILAKQGGGC